MMGLSRGQPFRLEEAILEVVKLAPASVQEVIRGLQALRGIAHISAVTIAAELGNITSRFESARKLMGYSGAFPSEDSSGNRIRKGAVATRLSKSSIVWSSIDLAFGTPQA